MCFVGPPSELLNPSRQKSEDYTVVPDWIDYPSNVAFKLHEMVSVYECMDSISDFERVGTTIRDCQVVIMRSSPEFEPDELSLLTRLYQKPVLPIGLLPPKLQDIASNGETWQVLKDWLDNKKEKSVVYVAFGTEVTLSQELIHELAYGLEKSGLRFMLVVRNRNCPLVDGEMGPHLIPPGFKDRVSGQGLVWTDWALQLRILSHPSVGGFLTHSGWSSVIKALGFGEALILLFGTSADTGLVARLMNSKRVGMEIERNERDGSFTSDSIAESIRRVVVDPEGKELRENAWAMKEIFGKMNLHNKYLNEFTRFVENNTASTRSL